MRDAPRFPWTRHRVGHWSAHGYEIIGKPGSWRILRNGEHWDAVTKLNFAKRLCERNKAKLDARAAAVQ